ncbi:pitrilysin family protein [Pseudovibrio exalbescens]|nr:pitrilysin family protein [Pseudovibrio exalbescens]
MPASAEPVQLLNAKDFSEIRIGGDVFESELENGMKVVVVPDHRAPVVTHMVWYKVGAADEPPGESGIAHFLEHLMFKGTKNAPEGEFSRVISEVGGRENAFTSQDYTAYFQRVAKEHLETMMRYEADRMENLVLTDEQVAPERDVVLQERAQRTDRRPSARLGETLDQMLYPNHPYGVPVIGWESEIKQLNLEDAIAFYDRYYTPNNAILIVAGDVSPEEVMGAAERTYGKVARRAEPGERVRPAVQILPGNRTVTMEDPQVAQPTLQEAWLVPSYNSDTEAEAAAIDVLADILGGGTNSRLYRKLAVEDQLATEVGSYYRSTALDSGEFRIYGIPKDPANFELLEREIRAVIADLITNGVTEEEVARSQRSMLASTIYAQDDQGTMARIFGTALTTGSSVAEVQEWPQSIAAVTPEDVQRVAAKYLEGPSIRAYLLPPQRETAENTVTQ